MTDNKEKNIPKTSFLEKEQKSRSEVRITLRRKLLRD